MKTRYRLDKAFGPVGSSAGMFLLLGGLIILYFSFSGLILIVAGAFIGFTSTGTIIDHDKMMIKFSNNLFGVLQIGRWISIDPEMKVGIKKSTRSWRAYGRGNQTYDISNKDFRIVLYDSRNKEVLQIQKAATHDSAKEELAKISNQLGLNIL